MNQQLVTLWWGFAPLLAQWIGLIATRHQRTRSWWVMISGTMVQTIGQLAYLVAITFLLLPYGRGLVTSAAPYERLLFWAQAGFLTGVCGATLFAIGFASLCFKRRAAGEREEQLEAMAASMAEELRVLRERVG